MDKSLQVICMGLMSHFGLIFFIYPERIIASTQKGQWEPILIQCVIFILFLSLYLKGLSYFPEQNIISILKVLGKGFSFTLLFPVLLYLVITTIELVSAYAEVTNINLFSEYSYMGNYYINDRYFNLYRRKRNRNHLTYSLINILYLFPVNLTNAFDLLSRH
ncbi:GerAB/ArcD/ProY family transporter [Peribacillus frigoritolerans]|uniref:GerAB/ArcD/ProY family transporter n=1 Tax=Peribacillus frigoritolerans TaxID=450367 RepID=UPI002B2453F9|nr:GerAB/ArcD/ProY family transporter [Peribacillus frigoritolerans]MEB2631927.1 GerAB/ArcD/ProY family transporter [Peribacillus frigoritolerans]